MAAPDLDTEEGRTAALALLDPDFQGLLEKKQISERLQGALSNVGVRSISRFSVIGDAAADVRAFAVDTAGLERARDVVQIAGLVDAWEACKTRMRVRHQAEADASVASLPPPVHKVEAQDLRLRFEQMHYRLEDKVAPSTGTLEQLFDQIEAGEWKNMALAQFMSREDQDTEPLAAMIDKTGTLRVKKGFGEGRPPKTGEELRQRIKLLAHCYLFCQLKYPHRAVLRHVHPNLFNKYADYLMGEHVMGLKAKDSRGEVVATPTLELVLSYEFQVRKFMTKAMNEGKDMRQALEEAIKDTTTKERYFLTPATLEAATQRHDVRLRSRSPRRDDYKEYRSPRRNDYKESRSPRRDDFEESKEPSWGSRSNWTSKSRGEKGKKGGGKGKKGGKTMHSRTPDGRDICYSWNNRDQRCRYNCGRVHCCQICFGNHPAHSCKGGRDQGGEDKDTDARK